MLGKFQSLSAELGRTNALVYLINKMFEGLGGAISLQRYLLVAQPVRSKAILPSHRGRNIEIRTLNDQDSAFDVMPLPEAMIRHRLAQGAVCIAAFEKQRMIGYLWLCLGVYDEDELRCRFAPDPEGEAAWDVDIYVDDAFRSSFAFARLWDAANAYFRQHGIRWSMSKISVFNLASLASHRSLGATPLGNVTFILAGRWQMLLSSLRPSMHLSTRSASVPLVRLQAPEQAS